MAKYTRPASIEYWLKSSKDTSYPIDVRMLTLQNAFNHLENAYVAALQENEKLEKQNANTN